MRWLFFFGALILFTSCQDTTTVTPDYMPELMEIPKGFPAIDEPADNVFSTARWELGKKLFFDPIMSVDHTLSCASCHKPELAFSDNLAFSPGVENRPGTRNAPSLANVAYHPYFLREGGVPTLEMQILVPIQEHNEFDFNIVLLADRLNADSTYVAMAREAYDRAPDAFVITRAIACFERSLLSGYSLYDQYTYYGVTDALSPSAINGMQLFFSERTNCTACHSGFNFTDYGFENNGLYVTYADPGRFRHTGNEADRALFKVPGLRNVALTAPYMHDGSLPTLASVVDHYISGGKNHPHKNHILNPIDLMPSERVDLIAFLESLTDETFISNPIFKH